MRKYENTELIMPLFFKIFKENFKVYDPNFWGSIEDLTQTGPTGLIDTNGILLYMHAGWDTAFSINENNQIALVPFYTPIDYKEISGLFFFESWYLSPDNGFLEKDVIAYFPVREYWDEHLLETEQRERQQRLVFMVYTGEEKCKFKKSRPEKRHKDLTLIYKGIEYELGLFNHPYNKYTYRDTRGADISDEEYNEWAYHTFDFYKLFDPERFLKVIIQMILDGRLHAVDPYNPKRDLTKEEIIRRIGETSYQYYDQDGQSTIKKSETIRYDNLNSVVFNEDWYFDPDLLKICKKVNSITIVKHDKQHDEYTGDYLRLIKTPVITVVY